MRVGERLRAPAEGDVGVPGSSAVVEDLAEAHGEEPALLEVLRQRREVPAALAPVLTRYNAPSPARVGTARSQQRLAMDPDGAPERRLRMCVRSRNQHRHTIELVAEKWASQARAGGRWGSQAGCKVGGAVRTTASGMVGDVMLAPSFPERPTERRSVPRIDGYSCRPTPPRTVRDGEHQATAM